ncbi:MAG: hypothetical protein II722_07420 [Ruminococcus sp.]|uniref:hypothetical protein n=1 Tax=Ruminococcus sp. FC2018 TaxID=1410617 RepID=UPI00049114A5|nr:hypothetical protein [Ruminococcus sp. FC2018]MBQ3936870.1 hypothetical protein [Ruminococcus sp.]
MKKILSACICIIMAVSMVACGSSSSSSDSKSTSSKSSASSSADSKSDGGNSGDSSGQDLSKYKFNKGELVRITDDNNEPAVADLEIKGLIVAGNQTEGAGFDAQKSGGYKTSGLKADFMLNEHITLHAEGITGNTEDLKIICLPHREMADYILKSADELTQIAETEGAYVNASGPDAERDNEIVDFYVGPIEERKAGSYDILFVYKGKLAYYLPIELSKPAE